MDVLILMLDILKERGYWVGMTAGENVFAEDLHKVLAEIEGKELTQRLMVVINYLEDGGLNQKEAAERYGYTGG